MLNHVLSLEDQTFHRDGTGVFGGFELLPSLLLAAYPSPGVVPSLGGELRVLGLRLWQGERAAGGICPLPWPLGL